MLFLSAVLPVGRVLWWASWCIANKGIVVQCKIAYGRRKETERAPEYWHSFFRASVVCVPFLSPVSFLRSMFSNMQYQLAHLSSPFPFTATKTYSQVQLVHPVKHTSINSNPINFIFPLIQSWAKPWLAPMHLYWPKLLFRFQNWPLPEFELYQPARTRLTPMATQVVPNGDPLVEASVLMELGNSECVEHTPSNKMSHQKCLFSTCHRRIFKQ